MMGFEDRLLVPLQPSPPPRGGSDPAAPRRAHRNLDIAKRKESRSAFQEQRHSETQPSTSRPGKKAMQTEAIPSEKFFKKKKPIPKIIVTGPSDEVLVNSYTDELPETKTIRDTEDYGPYTVHSRPSTIDAYRTSKSQ